MQYKFFKIAFIGWLLVVSIYDFAGASEFGPFQGKILDAETKEPIEGVVVFIKWREKHAFAGSTFYDAQEALTDKDGEFYIPGIWVFNPLVRLRAQADAIIYKSGYEAIGSGPWKSLLEREWGAPKGTYIFKFVNGKPVIVLKRLSPEERIRYMEPSVSYKVPCEKWKLLREEINKENRFRGIGETGCFK